MLLVYLGLSVLLFGRHALTDPAHHCVCSGLSATGDPPAFMWALAWWPHAIAEGLNPFYSNAIWAPGGANVAAFASIPGPSLLLAPITDAFGPVVSYNVLAVMAPALSAYTAFVLCRYLTRAAAPAFVGGLIFGFGSYEVEHLTQHPNLFSVFFIPLFPYLVLKRLDGTISRGWFVSAITAAFVGQFLFSTELTVDIVIFGAVTLLTGYLLADHVTRRRHRHVVAEALSGGLIATVVLSPFIWWAVIKAHVPPTDAGSYPLDPLNLVVPTPITLLGGHAFGSISRHFPQSYAFPAGITEDVGYVGVPLLAACVSYIYTCRRARSTKLLAVVGATACLCALGSHLIIYGHRVAPAPWQIVSGLPLFRNLLPARFMLFVDLALAIGIALWLHSSGGRVAWTIAVIGVLATFPAVQDDWWSSSPNLPQFITAGVVHSAIRTGSTVLTLPYGVYGDGQLWQAESGFTFKLAATYVLKSPPPEYRDESAPAQMALANRPPTPRSFASMLRRHQVSAILLDASRPSGWPTFLSAFGLHARVVGGIMLYAVRGQATPEVASNRSGIAAEAWHRARRRVEPSGSPGGLRRFTDERSLAKGGRTRAVLIHAPT